MEQQERFALQKWPKFPCQRSTAAAHNDTTVTLQPQCEFGIS